MKQLDFDSCLFDCRSYGLTTSRETACGRWQVASSTCMCSVHASTGTKDGRIRCCSRRPQSRVSWSPICKIRASTVGVAKLSGVSFRSFHDQGGLNGIFEHEVRCSKILVSIVALLMPQTIWYPGMYSRTFPNLHCLDKLFKATATFLTDFPSARTCEEKQKWWMAADGFGKSSGSRKQNDFRATYP